MHSVTNAIPTPIIESEFPQSNNRGAVQVMQQPLIACNNANSCTLVVILPFCGRGAS